jgi:hypothetical protein
MVRLDEPSCLGDRRHNLSDIVRERPGKLSNAIIQLIFEWIIKSLLFLYNVFKGETAKLINALSIAGLCILSILVFHEQLGSDIH